MKRVFLILLVFCFLGSAFSSENGSVRVTVRDSLTGSVLQGAVVTVQGTRIVAVTERDGSALLTGVAAGEQTLSVSYLGYKERNEKVAVKGAERVAAEIRLESEILSLNKMDVRGLRTSQSKAINQQKSSDNIVSVLSSDVIGNFPDISVAEAAGRVSGVNVVRFRGEGAGVSVRGGNQDWTKVTVNGISLPSDGSSRSVALNEVSSDVVSMLEISKTPTPDMDADAVGGTVNIVTRGALDEKDSYISGYSAGGLSQLGMYGNFHGALTIGRKFGASDNIGLLVSASHSRVRREMENLETVWTEDTASSDGYVPTRFVTKAYDIVRSRTSLSGRLDYAPSKEHHLFVNYMRNYYNNDEDRHTQRLDFEFDRRLAGSGAKTGEYSRGRFEYDFLDRYYTSVTNIINVGGEHTLGSVDLDYQGAYTDGDGRYSKDDKYKNDNISVHYRQRERFGNIKYDYSDPDFPIYTLVDAASSFNLPADSATMEPRTGSRSYIREEIDAENTIQALANAKFPLSFSSFKGFAKTGAKVVNRTRERERWRRRFANLSEFPNFEDIASDRDLNNFDKYLFGKKADKEKVHKLFEGMTLLSDTNANSISSDYADDYKIEERIAGGYGMLDLSVDRFKIIAGLRAEHTATTADGYLSRDGYRTIPEKSTYSRSYFNLFPSATLRFAPNDYIVTRFAYTQGISRPSFDNLRNTASIDEANDRATAANPDLEPVLSRGIDLMAEYYFRPMGVVSGGFFYRNIDNAHFGGSRVLTEAQTIGGYNIPAGWTVSQTLNAEKAASIIGIELSWDHALTFLPGALEGLGIFTNYTYIKSKAEHPETKEETALGEQPDHTVNMAIYYEKKAFSARLAYNFQSPFISDFSDGTSDNMLWMDSRGILDFTASYTVTTGVMVYTEMRNLTNSYGRRYQGVRERVYELEQFGQEYALGVRVNF